MNKKLRMTHQREIILRELRQCTSHPSADELYERVKKILPRISLATVYRNLEILSASGTIGKIEISGRQKRFDWEIKQHTHIHCMRCHRVDNIELAGDDQETLRPENTRGYQISGCRIEFTGFCPECQKKTLDTGETIMGCKKCETESLTEPQRRLLKALEQQREACGSKDLAAASGLEAKEVSSQLTALKKKGLIASPARCRYAITPEGKKAIA